MTALLTAGLLGSFAIGEAGIVDTELSGNTAFHGWEALHNGYYDPADHGGGYPGSADWALPMVANEGEAEAELMKVSGTGYPGSSSLYSSAGGVFSVSDDDPLPGLQTLVFSISIGAGTTGDIVTGPTLSVNGGTSIGAADQTWDLGSSQATIGGFEVTQTRYSYQWDLSGFGSGVDSYDIRFSTGEHAQTYAMQLDEGDSFSSANPTAIPEPSTLLLLTAGLAGAAVYRGIRSRTSGH